MKKEVTRHVEWKPAHHRGLVWFARVGKNLFGYAKYVRPGVYEAKARGERTFRYYDTLNDAGRYIVGCANYCYPSQLPR